MIRQVKIIAVTRYTKDKNGSPLITKTGKSYTRVSLNVEGYDKRLSGFESDETKNWKEGDLVEIDVEENGQYLNFKVPKKSDIQADGFEKRIQDLERKVGLLEGWIKSEPLPKNYPDPDEVDFGV